MTLEIKKFTQKPFCIEAVQVTTENMADLASWCEGRVISHEERDGLLGMDDYIKVVVFRPAHIRHTQAFRGDWVLRSAVGYKVYTTKALEKAFVEVPESDPEVVERLETVFAGPTATSEAPL